MARAANSVGGLLGGAGRRAAGAAALAVLVALAAGRGRAHPARFHPALLLAVVVAIACLVG